MSYAINKKHTWFILKFKKIDGLNSVFLLATCFMFYGLNSNLNLALLPLIFLIFITNINKDIFCLYYFALMFFEPVLTLPFELGSVFRIYQSIFLIKILNDFKNNVTFNNLPLHKVILAIILITWSLVTSQGMSTVVSMIINLIMLLYIFSRISSNKRKDENYSLMLFIMFLFSMLSGFYGLYSGNVIAYGSSFSRLSGTIGDPNYTALFYLLGIFSLLGTEVISSLRIKVILCLVMSMFMLLTVSLQGIAGLLLLFVLYFFIKDKKIAIILMLLIVFTAVGVYYLPVETGALFGIKMRIINSVEYFITGDYSALTSNRTDLFNNYLSYFVMQSSSAILFGGQNIIVGNTREIMLNLFSGVSHNSYLDMLYAVGVVGTLYILGCFSYDIIKNLKNYKKSKKEYYLSIIFLKLSILWFAMGISMFPFRYFLTYMFL